MFCFDAADKEVNRIFGNLSNTAAIHFIKNRNKKTKNALSVDDVLTIKKKFPYDDFIIFSDDPKYCKKKFSNAGFKIAEYNDTELDEFIINIAAMR